MTASVITETAARFRADPSAGRTAPSVTAVLEDGRARLSAGTFTWESDLPASIGGTNTAPSPTAYLLGALAGCGVAFLADTLAPEFGVRIEGISAVARCRADLGGLVGVDGTSSDLTDIVLEIQVQTPDPDSRTGPMFEAWRRRCPIYLALRNASPVELQITAGAR
jgi:uncharacterized OsmC-like protein